MTEPFASGFESERPVHVFVPEGYSVGSVTSEVDSQSEGHLTWDAGTDLCGFELVVTPPDDGGNGSDGSDEDRMGDGDGKRDGTTAGGGSDGSEDGAGDSGPGFGVLAAVGAVLAVAVPARRRQ